jgi:hypothetical protein
MDNVMPSPLPSIIIPLVGAAICSLRLLTHPRWPVQRWLYVCTIAATALTVLATGLGMGTLEAARPYTPYLEPILTLLWMPLTSWAALLLFAGLLIGQFPRVFMPLPARHASLRLILLSSSVAILTAANLVILLLAWGVQLLVLLLLRALEPADQPERKSPWEVWTSLASTGLLMVGALAVLAGQQGVLFLIEIWPGLALSALSAAVALRLVAWPLAGGLRRNWDIHLMSLVTGFYLWVRIGHSIEFTGALLGGGSAWVMLLAALSIAGALRQTPERALSYVVIHWIIVALLAPFVNPDVGYVASLLITMHLIVCLLVLRIYQTTPVASLRLGQIPHLVAWASLGGFPLTAGFVGHWLLVRSTWQAGAAPLNFWVLLSYLAIAIPAWSQWRIMRREAAMGQTAPPEKRPTRQTQLALPLVSLLAIMLVALGVYPRLADILWPSIELDLVLLDHRLLWGGSLGAVGLVLATALAPLLGGLTWRLDTGEEGLAWPQAMHRLGSVFDADWLYLVLGRQIERVMRVVEQGFGILEGSFALGWVLLWFIALLYYVVGI